MRRSAMVIAAVGISLCLSASGRAEETFPRPPELEPAIRFWRDIFTAYSRNQVVLHDAVDLDKVYKVLDFRSLADEGWSQGEIDSYKKASVESELSTLRETLERLSSLGPDPVGLSPDEQAVYNLFKDDPSPDRFLEAAGDKRLHSQTGLRERFREGLEISRRYMDQMEGIFRDEGLPVELTRMPMIESCFNVRAYSKVGAAGIWQFMPATGRMFLDVGERVDERRDPIVATRAAAQFLRRLYDRLGEWPLAITSWNHGPEGIARAVDDVGTSDIVTIIRDYRGPSFGFASRNFYVEFLAALDVDRNVKAYFPDIQFHAPVQTAEQYLTRSLSIDAAARGIDLDPEELASLNPALTPPVAEGRAAIPSGYRLRLPQEKAVAFDTWLADYEQDILEREARAREDARLAAERAREEAAERRAIAAAARKATRTARASGAAKGQARAARGSSAAVTKVQVQNTSRLGRASRLQRTKSGKASRS